MSEFCGGDDVADLRFMDLVSMVTTVIPQPPEVVWPRLVDQATWMTEFKIETVSGERGREGELKRVSAPAGQAEFPHFFFKTLLLVPFRRFVYKAFSGVRDGQFAFTGIEILSLGASDRGTAVSFEAYLEIQSFSMTPKELDEFVRQAKHDSAAMWHRNFDRLASLIAGQTA